MAKLVKTLVIWCSLSFICTFLIYLFHGENIQLLKIDALNLFIDNRHVFWREIFPLITILMLFLGMCLLKKRIFFYG